MNDKNPLRVLLVDDDPSILLVLKEILEREFPGEFIVKSATDPVMARWHLNSEIFDLLITDLKMPGISGLELLRSAKRSNVWTQVMVVTGHSNVQALMDAMDLGANDYLLKPLKVEELEEAITNCLKRTQRWRSALDGTITERNKKSVQQNDSAEHDYTSPTAAQRPSA
jgi:DNA-binding NtrC family response regulator